MRLLPYGERAVLVETDAGRVLALGAAASRLPGVLEVVPAHRTLLVEFDPAVTAARRIGDALRSAEAVGRPSPGGAPVEIPVRYDGWDLAAVAREVGLSAQEVVTRHAAGAYVVAFCGFSPGFAYLTGLDPALHVGRLSEPRTTVPAGAVGLAAEFTGVYPRSSPGGWRLIGHTDARLWDVTRVQPALLTPGTPVRFVAR